MSLYNNRLILLPLLAAAFLAGCGTVSSDVKSTTAPGFAGHVSRVAVWSDLDNIARFSQRRFGMSDSFANVFSATLKSDLAGGGATADVHGLPVGSKPPDLTRLEQPFAPEYRLVIAAPKYRTVSTRGSVDVLDLDLEINLFTVKDHRRVWHSDFVVHRGIVPKPVPWNESDAQQLAHDLVGLLRKDGLVI